MNAGALDKAIVIEQATATRNAAGEKTRTWTAITDAIAASVEYPSARQAMNSQQMQSEIDAVFTVRYRTDILPTETYRVIHATRAYRVKAVREIGRKVGLRLDCTARAE